ncbi:MAG: TetR-like C-terminal domain-containing protein, partial [Leptospirales bacterium]
PYAHFKSKRELLRAVAASGFDELAERMLAVQGRQNRKIKGRELAVKYGVEYLRFALESPAFYKVMMSQLEPTPGPPARSAPDKQTPEETIQGAPESVPDAAPPGPGQAASRSPMPAAIRVSLRRPFLLLYGAFASGQLDKKTAQARAIGAWATVHGMAALIIDGHLAVPEGMDAIDLFQAAVGDKL